MMGHLVFGRYGRNDASPLHKGKSWAQRLWTGMFARKPAKAH